VKAITLQQPWATLVAIGAKRIETRCWRTHYRGPLAIAASAKQGKEGRELMGDPQCYGAMQLYSASRYWGGMAGNPYGSVIAVCNLVECLPMEAYICLPGIFDEYPELDTIRERAFGDFDVIDKHNGRRRWAFVLEDTCPLAAPVPVKGGLGIWETESGAWK
jgi:activating signal cointegrator 1